MKKKVSVFLSDRASEILAVHRSEFGVSNAVNWAIEAGHTATLEIDLQMSRGMLLYACDVLNGNTVIAGFENEGLEWARQSILHTLLDGDVRPQKWGLDISEIRDWCNAASDGQIAKLVLAVRHFWSKEPLQGFRPISEYKDWARQWV